MIILQDTLGQAAGQTGAIRLHIQLGHAPVFHQHGESLAAYTAQDRAQVQLQLQGLGQGSVCVGQHTHLGGS